MSESQDRFSARSFGTGGVLEALRLVLEARDDARDNVDDEKIIDLQSEAGMIYESLNISLD